MYVVSMDLEKFFDTVSHSKLIEVLSRTIKDGRVVSLIHKYLNAGVIQNGFFEKTEEGVPQGGLCKAEHYAKNVLFFLINKRFSQILLCIVFYL